MKKALVSCLLLVCSLPAHAQQVADTDYRFQVGNPMYSPSQGSRVCIDSGHHNYHTAEGRYEPFAELITQDGFQVVDFPGSFIPNSLASCDVLVIANALHASNSSNWSFPHPPAFNMSELQTVQTWVGEGGSLLLIADHSPFAGAAADLGAIFGLLMSDVYAVQRRQGPEQFMLSDQTLHPHPIVQGRNQTESIQQVTSFTGQAARFVGDWQALLSFSNEAFAYINPQQAFMSGSDQVQAFSVAGWVQAAAREWEAGRIVFLGEAAMCSAQISGNGVPMGMNSPQAPQNAQFCLNLLRWLSKSL